MTLDICGFYPFKETVKLVNASGYSKQEVARHLKNQKKRNIYPPISRKENLCYGFESIFWAIQFQVVHSCFFIDGHRKCFEPTTVWFAKDNKLLLTSSHNTYDHELVFLVMGYIGYIELQKVTCDAFSVKVICIHFAPELSRKSVQEAFWNDLHQELLEVTLDYTFKGKDSWEECMKEIDKLRLLTNYQHQCHPECQIRGKVIKLASHTKPQNNWVFCVLCSLWQAVTDGIWKLRYPVCTHKMPMAVQRCPLRHYLDCCPGEPVHGKPFCWNHAGREQWCTTVHTIAITSITMLYIM